MAGFPCMVTNAPVLPGIDDIRPARVRWFSSVGCVEWTEDGAHAEVFVGGTLVGAFARRERGARNVVLVGLAADPKVHLGKLAQAFGLDAETLRRIREQHQHQGLRAVLDRAPGGSEKKLHGRLRRLAEKLFASDASLATVRVALAQRHLEISVTTLSGERAQWRERLAGGADAGELPHPAPESAPPDDATEPPPQQEFWADEPAPVRGSDAPGTDDETTPPSDADEATLTGPAEEHQGAKQTITSAMPRSGRAVQHLGSWLLLASVVAMGLHEVLEHERLREARTGRRLRQATLRCRSAAVRPR